MNARFAVYTLASVGDELLRTCVRRGRPPAVIVTEDPAYFAPFEIPMVTNDDPDLVAKLRDHGVEFTFVAGWTTKIAHEQFGWMPRGGWNMHPSLLPKYRGWNPYYWVIAAGETTTGITVHTLSDRFDCGDILLQREFPVLPLDTMNSLFARLVHEMGAVGCDAIERIAAGDPQVTPQPAGTYPRAPKVRPAHLELTSALTRKQVFDRVRAANPDFGAWLTVGTQRIKVFEAASGGVGLPIPCVDGVLRATVIEHPDLGIFSGARFAEFLRRR